VLSYKKLKKHHIEQEKKEALKIEVTVGKEKTLS